MKLDVREYKCEQNCEDSNCSHINTEESGSKESNEEEQSHLLREHNIKQQSHTERRKNISSKAEAASHPIGNHAHNSLYEISSHIDRQENGNEIHQRIQDISPNNVQMKCLLELSLVNEDVRFMGKRREHHTYRKTNCLTKGSYGNRNSQCSLWASARQNAKRRSNN